MASLYNTKFYHRDLSWLRFNHRVLQEAADERNPLYERIKFLAIFSSNLDEFFRVRVSDIRQIKHLDKTLRKRLITKPNRVLKEIKKQVDIQQQEFGKIFNSKIIPELATEGIHLIRQKDFSAKQKEIAADYYQKTLKNIIQVNHFSANEKHEVFVKNETLYLAAQFTENEFAMIEIPDSEPRFFVFPSEDDKTFHSTFIDDILKYNLEKEFSETGKISLYSIKISRDAELYIEDEFSGNLMEKIKAALPKRDTGQATRILIDPEMPEVFQKILKQVLDVSHIDVIIGGRYHNFKDFISFPNPTKKNLSAEKLPPLPHPVLKDCDSIFKAIEKKDQLLHFPYQRFDPVIQLMEEAATDPSVTTIQMTIYRTASESALNKAITLAAKNGKDVTIFMEVKARFDEDNNLKWGAIFKKHGVKVIYSYPDIKVHSKILYIEKEIDGKERRYAYIGTGNFNENTATLYTDFGLMTAHKKITKDIKKVFMVLEGKMIVPKTKEVIVSPFSSRLRFTEMVEREIALVNAEKKGSIALKMNSLEDKGMIKELYKASNAGVKIELLIRGMCSLVPGIKGQSENIHITSIVDRFLEHGRIYIFGNDGNTEVFIGSADWMTRNLTHRIEVITPVLDEDHKKTVLDVINIELEDNVKARIIDADQKNEYVRNSKKEVRSQLAIYRYFESMI
ncbi:polyphosphate kinase 1 [Aequorivita viscosa]|uniref:Polyphosphate kinase n=1 Tax=Aequorivita viscosa TaxID=797419 RepID=A0A1M6LVM9_9FLAO|nr:polyphosphate kinase 1 [Aequorivita viscosa]SDX25129.1 polyphosphate kinase [Aequorivita viscosa]SHJ75220.1 polyphosphate kinase [Aequorivita viscosa]